MTQTKKKAKTTYKWWKGQQNPTERIDYKKALVAFIIGENKVEKYPEPNMETYRQVLAYLGPINKKWKMVTCDNLNAKWSAHKYYIDTLKNTLASKKELKSLVDCKLKEQNESSND